MDLNDMFKMLDLDTPAPVEETAEVTSDQPALPPLPQDPNALVLDRWTKRQGRQLHAKLQDELTNSQPARPIHQLDPTDLADFHGSVFNPTPELVEDRVCSDNLKRQYFGELFDTPSFQELRNATVLDDLATDFAIEKLATGLVGLRQQQKDKPDPGDGDGDGEPGEIPGLGKAVAKAINDAKQEVKDFQDAREGLGIGTENGGGGQYDQKAMLALYQQLRKSPQIQLILNLAGRYKLFAHAQQRQKITHGYDDVVGVTLGDEIPKLTQSELLNLLIPELEWDVIRRLLDKQAMIREHVGVEKVAKGPVIVEIDESSSMDTRQADGLTRLQHAKALALVMAYLARQQNRWCALISFSSAAQRKVVVLDPAKWDQQALLTWIPHFFSGGTEPVIGDLPRIYEQIGAQKGKTDITVITDGEVYIPGGQIEPFNAWRKEVGARVTTLSVASAANNMKPVSDEVHVIKALGFNREVGDILGGI
jgi:Mg-chelatase subunit ChlD